MAHTMTFARSNPFVSGWKGQQHSVIHWHRRRATVLLFRCKGLDDHSSLPVALCSYYYYQDATSNLLLHGVKCGVTVTTGCCMQVGQQV